MFDTILAYGSAFVAELLVAAGQSPFSALAYIMTHGGLVLFFPIMVWMLWWIWLFYVVGEYSSKQSYVLLAVDVPSVNEQSMRAVEQIIVALHGVLFHYNKKDLFWHGMQIEPFSLEIASIDGYIQYFIWSNTRYVDVVKAAVYAQYPDAEIVEVEDYAKNVPSQYPDDEYEMWGTELTLEKPSVYPLKTYEYFEHSLTGTFADPMAAILEQMSRLKPGEQAWIQIVITPTGSGIRDQGVAEVNSLIGKDAGYEAGRLEKLIFGSLDAMFNAAKPEHFEKVETSIPGREANSGDFMGMTTGERIVVEEIQKKITRLQFDTKMRFVYVGRKEVFDRFRVAGGVFGALKQFNSLDLNSFKNGQYTTTSRPAYFFWQRRRHVRETKLMQSYQGRSNWNGENPMTLSTTEIATLYHFPLENAQAPLLSTTESKKAEPPTRLPQQALPTAPESIVETPEEGGSEGGKGTGAPANLPGVESPAPIPMRTQRIPRPGEQLQPSPGIPQRRSVVPQVQDPVGKTLNESMEGLPPGVRPLKGSEWQDAQEWSLSQRAKKEGVITDTGVVTMPMQSGQTPTQNVAPMDAPPTPLEHSTTNPNAEGTQAEQLPQAQPSQPTTRAVRPHGITERTTTPQPATEPSQLRTHRQPHSRVTPDNPDERRTNQTFLESRDDLNPDEHRTQFGNPPTNLPVDDR